MNKGNIIFTILFFLGIGHLINKFGILKFLIGGLILALIVHSEASGSFIFLLMIYGVYKLLTK